MAILTGLFFLCEFFLLLFLFPFFLGSGVFTCCRQRGCRHATHGKHGKATHSSNTQGKQQDSSPVTRCLLSSSGGSSGGSSTGSGSSTGGSSSGGGSSSTGGSSSGGSSGGGGGGSSETLIRYELSTGMVRGRRSLVRSYDDVCVERGHVGVGAAFRHMQEGLP